MEACVLSVALGGILNAMKVAWHRAHAEEGRYRKVGECVEPIGSSTSVFYQTVRVFVSKKTIATMTTERWLCVAKLAFIAIDVERVRLTSVSDLS